MQHKPLKEKRWIVNFAVVVMLTTLIPYWIGFLHQGTDWVYTGFVFGVEDGNSYIAKMLSGSNGHWLFQSPYTAYFQKGAFAFLPYLLLGKFSAAPGIHTQLVVLFHFFRLLAGFLMIVATYDFISVFFQDVKLRRFGTVIAVLGGGLGWLSIFGLGGLWQNGLPLEFYSPETFGFLALFGLPHLAMARALLLWGLSAIFQPISREHPWTSALKGGLCWLAMSLFQPLTVVVGWVILGSYLLALAMHGGVCKSRNKKFDWTFWHQDFRRTVVLVCVSSPVTIYSFFAFSMDPFLKQWTNQNLILSPPIRDYLLSFGVILPLAFLGIPILLRKKPFEAWLVIGWVGIFPFLAYAPYNLQRRLPEGIWVALVVLMLSFLEFTENRNYQKWIKRVVSLSFLTTFLVFWGAILSVWTPSVPIYREKTEVMVYKFLSQQLTDREVVLASYHTSNALPAWVPAKTLIGHGPESVNLKSVQKRVERFFQIETDERYRIDLIEEFDVKYVVWGPQEKILGDYEVSDDPLLDEIYHVDDYWVFKINLGNK